MRTAAGAFDVYDRPDLGRLITDPKVGALRSGRPDLTDHAAAAARWISGTGRRCAIEGSAKVITPDAEHVYRCNVASNGTDGGGKAN